MKPAHLPRLRAAINGLLPSWPEAELADFRYLPGGYSNDNYRFSFRGTDYVLRLPSQPHEQRQLQQEQILYLAPGKVRIPKLVRLDTVTGTMICQWVHGRLLHETEPDNAALVRYLRQLHESLAYHGDTLAHGYDPLALGRRLLTAAPHQLPTGIAAQLGRATWEPRRARLCHNDLNPWNVIAPSDDAETWVTLDWQTPGFNDPVFDLVTLHQGLERDMSEVGALAERLLGERVDARRIEDNLRGFWLREYCWAFAMRQQGNQREEIAAQILLAESKLDGLSD